MGKLIAHLDADCFYVSCERVRHPILRKQPVGVLGNQGACVIAKSYEMKKMGIKTGQPIWEAVKICPEGIYVKRDFRWYEVLSRKLMDLLHQVSPCVEYYSIDEWFFDADHLTQHFGGDLLSATKALQQKILDETQVPVSIGVSTAKALAKLGSDSAKPFGCNVLLDKAEIETLLRRQPVDEIAGIASRSKKKLAAHNIHTCWDFAQADPKLIRRLLTIKGEKLWCEINGNPAEPIHTKRPAHKCISRGGSIGEATSDTKRIYGWFTRNAERLVEELDYYQVLTRKLSLHIEFRKIGYWTTRGTLPEPTACFMTLLKTATELWQQAEHVHNVEHPVSHIHLLADDLCYRHDMQKSLFYQPDPRWKQIDELKRKINQKIGRYSVRSGTTLQINDLYEADAHSYDICDVHGKMCF